ncbi:MAG: hypothetical protein HQL50_14985 [Magnetococcales bacterium]|nr:hypothetical protein [Magnetococcales bacterium]
MQALRKLMASPWLHILLGLILLVSAGMEIRDDIQNAVQGVKAHHGVFVFGLFHILKTLPDIFEGIEDIQKSGE